MKTITLDIDDTTYERLEAYSQQAKRSIPSVAADFLSAGLSMLDFNRILDWMHEKVEENTEKWRKKHAWAESWEDLAWGRRKNKNERGEAVPR